MSTTITAEAIYKAQIHNYPDSLAMEDCTAFVGLVERVRAKNPDAAGILETMAMDPKAPKRWCFVPSVDLRGAFTWAQTKEGHQFWSDPHSSLAYA